MSAIAETSPPNADLGLDNIRRYKTRCKILVHSHLSDKPVDIYDEVYACDLSKAIKETGKATFSLTPQQNWLNIIFPNDVVNIYFDIGDNSGWVRTFFGYVDRIEEQYGVDQTGRPTTYYRVVCSDFQKVFEKTQIYFNPHLAGRTDFIDFDFADSNIGGLALQSKGLVVGGAPSNVIQEIVLMLLGFGTQFRMPSSYTAANTKDRLRNRRIESVMGSLPKEFGNNAASAIATFNTLKESATDQSIKKVAEFYKNDDQEATYAALAEEFNVPIAQLEGKDQVQLQTFFSSIILENNLQGAGEVALSGTERAAARRVIERFEGAQVDGLVSLVDVIDPFTFVESRAMDGFMIGEPVWQKQGTVLSIMRAFSNEALNELFFDLRALNYDKEKKAVHTDLMSGRFGNAIDDANGNTQVTGKSLKVGTFYTPALVMREYPFSTIRGVNMTDVELQIDNADGTPEKVGYLQFGEIFASRRNTPGRSVVTIPNINIVEQESGGPKADTPAIKHLDIAVLNENEIVKTQFGRSDNDHYNLFEFYSDNVLGSDQKFYMKDFLPVITPIHITRNGLRLRSITTKAARFSIDAVRGFVRDGTPSLDFQGTRERKELQVPSEWISPIKDPDADVFFNPNAIGQNWGYRLKKEDPDDESTWTWDWHHGIDITQNGELSPKGNETIFTPTDKTPIEIQAIADGEVVVSAPDGVFGGYGDVVVVRHKYAENLYCFSVYSHLKSRSVGWKLTSKTGKGGMKKFIAAKDMTGVKAGRQAPIPIKQGDRIGFLGRTGVKRSKAHLHFEITRHFPVAPKSDPTQTTTQPYEGNPSQPAPIVDLLLRVEDSTDLPATQWSFDPASCFGGVLVEGLPSSAESGGEAETDRVNIPVAPEDTNPSKKDSGVTDEAEETAEASRTSRPRDNVDTASSRKQIFRWGLLQDHWYQHNLEYLSGTVQSRGAPEIRVGYRLDLPDRAMSFYVEGVNHSWRYPNNMRTNIKVSRGQPNNPFPVYVLPANSQLGAQKKQRRTAQSRLAKYFVTPDPTAIKRSLFINSAGNIEGNPGLKTHLEDTGQLLKNWTDMYEDGERDEQKDYTIVTSGKGENAFKESVIMAHDEISTSKDLTKTYNAESTDDSTNQSKGSIKNVPPPGVPKDKRS